MLEDLCAYCSQPMCPPLLLMLRSGERLWTAPTVRCGDECQGALEDSRHSRSLRSSCRTTAPSSPPTPVATSDPGPAGDAYRGALEAIGRELRAALELAKGEPDTFGHRAAWSRAERATRCLAGLVDESTLLQPALKGTMRKIV